MSTPTATPRTQALWMKHYAFCNEDEATEAICDFRDHGNALETELAAAKAECERLKADGAASAFVDMSVRASNAETELARLRADLERITGHGMLDCHAICDQRDAAVAERDQLRAEVSEARRAWLGDDYGHLPLIEALEKFRSDSDAQSDRADVLYQRSCEVEHALRAEVERLKGLASWANTCIHHNDAERARYGHVCLVCTSTRAEKAEAALAEVEGQTSATLLKMQQTNSDLRAEVERLKDGGVQRIKDALATALDTRDAAIARAERAEAALAARDAEYMRGGKMLAESAAGWQARAERAEASLHDLSLDLSTANHMIKLERDRADALQTRLKEIESALRKFNLID